MFFFFVLFNNYNFLSFPCWIHALKSIVTCFQRFIWVPFFCLYFDFLWSTLNCLVYQWCYINKVAAKKSNFFKVTRWFFSKFLCNRFCFHSFVPCLTCFTVWTLRFCFVTLSLTQILLSYCFCCFFYPSFLCCRVCLCHFYVLFVFFVFFVSWLGLLSGASWGNACSFLLLFSFVCVLLLSFTSVNPVSLEFTVPDRPSSRSQMFRANVTFCYYRPDWRNWHLLCFCYITTHSVCITVITCFKIIWHNKKASKFWRRNSY